MHEHVKNMSKSCFDEFFTLRITGTFLWRMPPGVILWQLTHDSLCLLLFSVAMWIGLAGMVDSVVALIKCQSFLQQSEASVGSEARSTTTRSRFSKSQAEQRQGMRGWVSQAFTQVRETFDTLDFEFFLLKLKSSRVIIVMHSRP